MQNYFDRELSQMEKELLRLKTSQQKFAGSVPTAQKSVQISVQLALSGGGNTATGYVYCKISSENKLLAFPTLAKYYDDITQYTITPRTTRAFIMEPYYIDNELFIYIRAYGTSNDVQTLKNGGTVTLTNTLTVVATDDFELEVV